MINRKIKMGDRFIGKEFMKKGSGFRNVEIDSIQKKQAVLQFYNAYHIE